MIQTADMNQQEEKIALNDAHQHMNADEMGAIYDFQYRRLKDVDLMNEFPTSNDILFMGFLIYKLSIPL